MRTTWRGPRRADWARWGAVLRVQGEKELQKYLVNEIQEVYRLQGVHITTSTSRSSRGR